MSYIPTEWKAGDTVTSQKLNKIENGLAATSGGAVLVVNAVQDNDTIRLDKTWQEITDAGFAVLWKSLNHELTVYQLYSTYYEENVEYAVVFATFFSENTVTFQSSTADGYPILYLSNDSPIGGVTPV